MSHLFLTLAQDAAVPSGFWQIAGVAVTSAVAGISGVWGWFRGELADCKKDRKELFSRVESLHGQVSDLSLRVGKAEQSIQGK